ncbi:MAG: tetratricopeptide repeat protein [Candidatus Melainabacteria bacterium]|nr:tetratricopeptide repeat protein [Candidatus Melainabacteria bacterium]
MTGIASPGLILRAATVRLLCLLALAGCSAGEKPAQTNWKDELRSAKVAAFSDNLEDAEQGFERVLAAISKEGKKDNAATVDVKARLALVYSRQGRLEEAAPLIKDVIAFVKKGALDEEHSEVLVLIDDISESIMQGPGREKAKIEDLLTALALQEMSQKVNRGRLVTTLDTIARAYVELGEPEQARPYWERALAIVEDRSAGNFTNNVVQMLRLYTVLERNGCPDDARAIYDRVMKLYDNNWHGLKEAIVLDRLGKAYLEEGLYEKALVTLNKSLEFQKMRKHRDTVTNSRTLAMVARCKEALGDPAEAERLLKEAIEMQETEPGSNNKFLYERMNEYVSFLKRQQRNEEAARWQDKAQECIRSFIPE